MIIEFVGCTGSGKTTLIKEVQQQLAKTVPVTTSIELVTGLIGLGHVLNPTIQNLVQEAVGFPFFLRSLYRYKAFLVYTMKLFFRNSSFSIRTINNLRSLERKIGVYEITKYFSKKQIILVDEGPILAAHMFVYTRSAYTSEEITQFTELLPLPDLIIYARAPINTLVERTVQRADPPHEIDVKDLALMTEYINNAVAIFDQLTQAENIRYRLLVVDSPDIAEPRHKKIVDSICQLILDQNL